MNREKLIQAGIDYDEGVRRFCGRTELYEKYLVKMFQEDKIEVLMEQLKDQNVAAAFRTAHDLKGSSGSLSVKLLYHAVCELVEILRTGEAEKSVYMESALKVREIYDQAKQAVQEA